MTRFFFIVFLTLFLVVPTYGNNQMEKMAFSTMTKARKYFNAGNYAMAGKLIRRARKMNPKLPEPGWYKQLRKKQIAETKKNYKYPSEFRFLENKSYPEKKRLLQQAIKILKDEVIENSDVVQLEIIQKEEKEKDEPFWLIIYWKLILLILVLLIIAYNLYRIVKGE